MRNQTFHLIAVILALTFSSCAKQETPVQKALGELRLLVSEVESGLKQSEYSYRLGGAQRRISAELRASKDTGAKARIEKALDLYVEAQRAWDRESEGRSNVPSQVKAFWSEGRRATEEASIFASADPAQRTRIWQQELAIVEAAARAELAAKEKAEQAERTRQVQTAEAEAQRWAAEQKHAEETAERERMRRFAPDGTVYSLTRISFITVDGVVSIAPGTELKIIGKTGRGMLHVKRGSMEAQVSASAVTNDRDLIAALHPPPVRPVIDDVRQRSASSASIGAPAAR